MDKLNLSVPKPRVESQGAAEVRPRRIREWLDELPLANHAEAARQIRQALYALNRVELDPDNRLEVMELYRGPATEVGEGLFRGVDMLGLPLSERAGERVDAARAIEAELATGYKLVVRDASRGAGRSLRNEAHAMALARAMEYLGRELIDAYDVYRPAPQRVWRELHTLYRIAEGQKLLNVPLDARSEQPTTAARTYQRVLLVGACNPYGMSQGDIRRVDEFLRVRGARAQIGTDTAIQDPAGQFLVNLLSDSAPVPFPRGREVPPQDHLRVLSVIELVRDVHGLLKSLEGGESPEAFGLSQARVDGAYLDLLRRMGKFWGLSIRRQSNRSVRADSVSLCIGLGSAHFFLEGGDPALPAAPEAPAGHSARYVDLDGLPAEPEAVQDTVSRDKAPAARVIRSDIWEARDEYVVYQWQTHDESAGGLALERRGEFETTVRVGELAGIEDPIQGMWRVGVIRWTRSEGPDQVEMGVQLLGPEAYAVSLREEAEAGVAQHPWSGAVLFSANVRLQRPETLVAPRGAFRIGMALTMRDSAGGQVRVKPVQVVERTGTFEQFVFVRSAGE
jgi:hypothetical protein